MKSRLSWRYVHPRLCSLGSLTLRLRSTVIVSSPRTAGVLSLTQEHACPIRPTRTKKTLSCPTCPLGLLSPDVPGQCTSKRLPHCNPRYKRQCTRSAINEELGTTIALGLNHWKSSFFLRQAMNSDLVQALRVLGVEPLEPLGTPPGNTAEGVLHHVGISKKCDDPVEFCTHLKRGF